MASVKRTIQFFRIVPLVKSKQAPKRKQLLTAISTIDPNSPSSRYASGPGEELCIWNDTKSPFQSNDIVRFALGKIRTTNIPGTVISGKRKNLQAANVLELCHCVVFANYIIAAEFNHYGPRVAWQLQRYLADKFDGTLEQIILKPLYDADIVETLNRFTQLRGMTIKIEREKIGLLNNADERISSALKNIGRPYPVANLELAINLPPAEKLEGNKEDKEKQRAERAKQEQAFSHQLFEEVVSMVTDSTVIDALKTFSVHGLDSRTRQMETINLLERRIHTKKTVKLVDNRHGMVDSDSMYNAIQEAYNELAESINTAVAAGIKVD